MADEALCHEAAAICHERRGDKVQAADSYEQAAALDRSAGEWDLAGEIWIRLAGLYGELRRYGRQTQALTQYLACLDRMETARSHEWIARYRLGQASLRTGRPSEAAPLLRAALRLAVAGGDELAAERSRGLLRAALLELGEREAVRDLQAESQRFLGTHPEAAAAAFWYWYSQASLAQGDGQRVETAAALRQAAAFARGRPTFQYAWHSLRYRFSLADGRVRDSLRAAQMARVTALEAGRYDLEFEMVLVMVRLISEYGPGVAEGLEEYCARDGLDLFRYIPEHLLQRP